MFLMNMYVKELPDCCWFNWSDVMFLEADSLDQHIGILPQMNPFRKETVLMPLIPNDPHLPASQRITCYS